MPGPVRYDKKGRVKKTKPRSFGSASKSQPKSQAPVTAAATAVAKATKRAVSRADIPKAARKARKSILASKEAEESIQRLRERFSTSVEVGQKQAKREKKLEDTALRNKLDDGIKSNRYDAFKAGEGVRSATRLNAEGTRVEQLDGLRQLGTQPIGQVQRAAEKNQLRRQGKSFTTPQVRQTQKKVKKAKRQLRRARAAAQRGGRINLPGGEGVFINELARQTKMDPRVLAAWTRSEGGNSYGDYNLLNIGHTGSGPNSAASNANFADPKEAAKATAAFLRGEWGGAGADIPYIVQRARGKDPATQIRVIEQSGWRLGSPGPDPFYSNLISGVYNDMPAASKPNPKAKARLQQAKNQAAATAKRANELGLSYEGIVTPRQAKGLGLKPLDQSNAPPKAVKSFKGMIAAAQQLEGWQLPYVWGGGHGTTRVGDPRQYGGLDCSSTVSHILQSGGVNIPTIVSGSFGEYTKPGPGAVTILYNPGHVLMKIGTKYFGTSGTNPSGGPGWIDKSVGDSEMASGKYSIGHIPGLGPKIAKQMNLDPESYRVFPGMKVENNTATAITGTVSYSPTFSNTPILEGRQQPNRGRKNNDVLKLLRQLGYSVTRSGVKRVGGELSTFSQAPESITDLKKRYKVE